MGKSKILERSKNKTFFIRNIRRIFGLFLMPLLYIRYSFVFFLPLLFIKELGSEAFFVMWFIYAIFFGFIMGNCGVMKYWTKLFQRLFKIKYTLGGQWTSDMLHSHSIWSHPILIVNEKEYKLSIAIMGGNLYEEDDNIRRKAIVYSLLS